jgi:hypothetical protein
VSTEYYTYTTDIPTKGKAYSSLFDANFQAIQASFALIPEPAVLKLGNVNTATTEGVADVYTATISTITAYADHQRCSVRFHLANTGASSINIRS